MNQALVRPWRRAPPPVVAQYLQHGRRRVALAVCGADGKEAVGDVGVVLDAVANLPLAEAAVAWGGGQG